MRNTPRGNTRKDQKIMGTNGTVELIVDQEYCRRVLPLLAEAKNNILICAYSWRIYPTEPEREIQKLFTAVARAVNRGVNVKVLADKYTQIKPLLENKIECRYIGSKLTMHTKAICVDDKYLMLGSHNLTARANEYNHEASVLIQEAEPIIEFQKYFYTIWGKLG